MRLIGVYGASGFGREVMPIVRRSFGSTARLVFIDDGEAPTTVNGQQVMSYQAFREQPEPEKSATLAIADGRIRERLASRCAADGVAMLGVEAENVMIGDNCMVGDGAILCGFVHLTADCTIGHSFHANIYSYVAHDCVVGDFVTFAPGVMCNGNVQIGDHAYIGTGAVIKQGRPGAPLRIGAGAVVGMGAVVTKDVPEGATVIGNPARLLERR